MSRASYEGDPRVAQSGQMLYSLTNSVLIVNADIGDTLNIGPNVDEYERNTAKTQMLEQRLFHTKRKDGDTVDAALNHAPNRQFHALRVIHGGGEQDFVVVLDCEILESLNDFREKRIGKLGDDQAENAAASGNQRSGLRVGIIAQFIDDSPDSLGELRINGRNAIDGSGNGSGGNLGSAGDFAKIHRLN